MSVYRVKKYLFISLFAGGLLVSCLDHQPFPDQNQNLTPRLAYTLPEQYNTPDGLALTPDNNMLLSVPNAGNPAFPAAILRLTDQGYELFATPTPSPETGKASPFDLAYGPDGNVYYADNQFTNNPSYKSRLMRIRIVNGQATTIEPVVLGFRQSNAVVWKGNTLYVSDSQWDTPERPRDSAIFRFDLGELNGGPVQLQPGFSDPHILATFTTKPNPDGDLGADGIDFDSQGNLFTGIFDDGTMYKLTLRADGSVESKTEFAQLPCVDGIVINRLNNTIFVCDAKTNAIRIVSPAGVVRLLAQNGDTDGTDGRLDEPAEPLLRNGKLYISNFDVPMPGTVNKLFDAPHTLSVLEL